MEQSNLPFDKREYRERMEAIEQMTTAATGLSSRRLKLVQDFLKRVFSHKRSSPEGDITFVQTDTPVRGQFSLAAEFFKSRRTIHDWIGWARLAGLIITSVDCDAWGDRRTSLSFEWPTIKSAASPPVAGTRKAQSTQSKVQSTQEQSAVYAEQSAETALSSKPITNTPKPQVIEAVKGGDFSESRRLSRDDRARLQKLKHELRTTFEIHQTCCVDVAIATGASISDVSEVIQHAKATSPRPSPGEIVGRIRQIGKKPNYILAAWPHQISAAQKARVADAIHEAKKRQRRREVARSGATETSDAIAEALFVDPPPELTAAIDAEFDQIERDVGPIFDALPPDEQLEFVRTNLTAYQLKLFLRTPALVRDEVLEAYRDRCLRRATG